MLKPKLCCPVDVQCSWKLEKQKSVVRSMYVSLRNATHMYGVLGEAKAKVTECN